jgi:predicted GH43/DUF377 family glycosyl hydrolase
LNWNKLGLIALANPEYNWMCKGAGPAFGRFLDASLLEIYMAGRDAENRTRIGRLLYSLKTNTIAQIDANPVLDLGELGLFDFNGTSYPWLVEFEGETRLYYTGWTRGYHVSFINDVGLAYLKPNGHFENKTRAALLPRTHEEPYGIGSVCVLNEDQDWKMWYTCFASWEGEDSKAKHYYHIKYAHSEDGIHWQRPNIVAIDFDKEKGEYVTGKPAVIKYKDYYIMWYSYRGETYKIGVAVSKDGINWHRFDDACGISASAEGWDSDMVCYGQVIAHETGFYMLYNGNGYGAGGLGLAHMEKAELDVFLESIKLA